MAKIKKAEDLLDEHQLPASLTGSIASSSNHCSGVCVIKPNQPINVIMRTLKSIANLNPESLAYTAPGFVQISRIETYQSYSTEQLELLFKHDIGFDPSSSENTKAQFKVKHEKLFADLPALQFVVSGHNALGKLKALIGPASRGRGSRNGQAGEKDQLRSFYGVDRVDNAFFVSESVDEALLEESVLFTNTNEKADAPSEESSG